MMSINSLPTEMLQRIFGVCSRDDQKAISAVCHYWADVAQPTMLQWTCLKVSYGVWRPFKEQFTRSTRIKLIDKSTLQQSNRPYSCLSIEWRCEKTLRKWESLSELLDVCEERFVVQRLFLRAPPNTTLVQFFEKRQQWLKDIVELHVKLGSTDQSVVGASVYGLSLPHLTQLTWHEQTIAKEKPGARDEEKSNLLFGSWHGFALDAPELRRLEVELNVCLTRNSVESRLQNPNACVLFLPTLELKSYPKLQNVTIKELYRLSQSRIDDSERFLQNLTMLTFVRCDTGVITQICEKCSNLKELTVDSPLNDSMSLQISPTLSATLEHLTIKGSDSTNLDLRGEAEFQKLQSICLNDVSLEHKVTLIAPQLTTWNTFSTDHSKLRLRHKKQIRTMKVQFDCDILDAPAPPPKVTELFLDVSIYFSNEHKYAYYYLNNFPHLRRLSIIDSYEPDDDPIYGNHPMRLRCEYVESLRRLQHFSAFNLAFWMYDVQCFKHLKSLVLSRCVLKTDGEDETDDEGQRNYMLSRLQLTALEYVRMYHVEVEGVQRDRFPIRVNERQPPIEVVEVASNGHKIFSSKHFEEPVFG